MNQPRDLAIQPDGSPRPAQPYCQEVTRELRPYFNGSIFVGGGARTCSRYSTMTVGGRSYCTFHGNRNAPERDAETQK
jgi:hypothetical protein